MPVHQAKQINKTGMSVSFSPSPTLEGGPDPVVYNDVTNLRIFITVDFAQYDNAEAWAQEIGANKSGMNG